jgi:hypothetical protein
MSALTRRSALPIILLLAVVLRLAAALYLGDSVPTGTDETSYSALGARVAGGYGLTFDRGWYPFTPPNTPTAHWSFLYTGFVAAIYSVAGPHPLSARLVSAIIGGILLPWMMYRLARRLYAADYLPEALSGSPVSIAPAPPPGSAAAMLPILAALLGAVYLFFVQFAASLMTETLYISALLWSLERALAVQQRARSGHAAAHDGLRLGLGLGISLGIAALLRQSLLPWAPVMGLWLLWRGWRHGALGVAFRALVVAASITVACILPFTLRNFVVFHHLLLLNSNAGYAMYSAQHPMHGTSFREYDAAPLPEGLDGLNEAQLDKELMRRGVGFILDDPDRYALLSLSRVRDYFEFWPTPNTPPVNNIGRVLSIGLFLPFMIYGVWLAIRNPVTSPAHDLLHPEDVAFLLLYMTFYSILHLLTWAMSRYRLPVDAVALLFAALALLDLARRLLPGHLLVATTTVDGEMLRLKGR